MRNSEEPKVIVIIGPTASGKTSLAIKLALQFNGEIISADSRAIYRYMDIGTAKPTKRERALVRHWGIDLVEPDKAFTAYDFKKYAVTAIQDIKSRNKVPFLVGGSGLYIDSVIYDYNFSTPSNSHLRDTLSQLSVAELQDYCNNHNINLPENYKNRRYLIRAIETNGQKNKDRREAKSEYDVVGIATDKQVLEKRIAERANKMFDDGVVRETTSLSNRYGWENESMKSNIYSIANKVISEGISLEEARRMSVQADLKLVKKQLTWFKRNEQIKWLSLEGAYQYIANCLQSTDVL